MAAKVTAEEIKDLGFSAQSFAKNPDAVALGDDSLNYTCISPHKSTADTQPPIGANWTDKWVLGGEKGDAWVNDTPYEAPFTTFIDKIITKKSTELAGLLGTSVYDTTNEPQQSWVKEAEECMVAAELLLRRINLKASNIDGKDMDAFKLRRNMKHYKERYKELIGFLREETDVSFSSVTTSHFEDTEDA
jgi:hypothetical protein